MALGRRHFVAVAESGQGFVRVRLEWCRKEVPARSVRLPTPTDVRGLLAAHDLRPSRALGQNFLADPNTARRIVRLARVGPGDRVLEVGPGIGSLTVALAEAVMPGGAVLALELERHLLPVLG